MSGVEVGMVVKAVGVPAKTTILSKTTNSFTMSANAAATTTDLSFEVAHVVEFIFPPKEPKGEKKTTSANTSESLSGLKQISVNYIEGFRTLTFSFLSEDLKNSLETFLDNWGMLGQTFRYYDNKESLLYKNYEIESLKYDPRKIAPKGLDIYVWEIALEFRRLL